MDAILASFANPTDPISGWLIRDGDTIVDRFHPPATASDAAGVLAAYLAAKGAASRPTVSDVVTERTRRLGLGFDYDFEDGRGVHRIGTTEADMKGWDEVGRGALAAIALGAPDAEIRIVTDTGAVTVTAIEWQRIVAFVTNRRQAIWQASFALQAMDPIPEDYAGDSHWPDGSGA